MGSVAILFSLTSFLCSIPIYFTFFYVLHRIFHIVNASF